MIKIMRVLAVTTLLFACSRVVAEEVDLVKAPQVEEVAPGAQVAAVQEPVKVAELDDAEAKKLLDEEPAKVAGVTPEEEFLNFDDVDFDADFEDTEDLG